MVTDNPDMKPNETDADWCRRKGYSVGQKLQGEGGYGMDQWEITAIGEGKVLAKGPTGIEFQWTGRYRDWQPVETNTPE